MFSLNQLSIKPTKRKKYSYTVTGIKSDANGVLQAIKTVRDDGKEGIFTTKRYQELLQLGKITQTSNTTFDLKVDEDYNPNAGFTSF